MSVIENKVNDPSSHRRPKRGVPEGLWMRCPDCGKAIFRKEAEKRQGICPECDYHLYVSAKTRVEQLLDARTFEEWDAGLMPADPLEFSDKKPYAKTVDCRARAHGTVRRRVDWNRDDSGKTRGP